MIARVLSLGLFGGLGLLIGLAHFATLARAVRRHVGEGSRATAFALHVARMVAVVGTWVLIARLAQAPGLLAAFVGFLIARPIAVARHRAAP